ncbi:hypothetical protein [Aliifodinibius sp. S!AR15-10]|nr:hypothetical protein [Aliifodinibius sp. S!AR15-10]
MPWNLFLKKVSWKLSDHILQEDFFVQGTMILILHGVYGTE